jgi:ankyrin repeat protein
LERGADPNYDVTGYTALHWASGIWETTLTGKNGIVLPDSDDSRFSEWNALRGVTNGKEELVKALLAHGANPNARIKKEPPRTGFTKSRSESRALIGATPFLVAAQACDVKLMRILVAAGANPILPTTADPNASDEESKGGIFGGRRGGTTPLMVAAGLGRVMSETLVSEEMSFEAAKLALELGNDIDAVNDYGETALHGAAHTRNNKLVQYLVDHGARLNVRTTRVFSIGHGPAGQTPLDYSERYIQQAGLPVHEHTSTGDLLRKLGAE